MNTQKIVDGLQRSFEREVQSNGLRDNRKGTLLHTKQVDLMYALDNIVRGSQPEIEEGLAEANRVIASLRK